eukprot:4413-Heterococcus_DN1.PRE.1
MTDEQVAVAAAELSEEQQAVLLHGGTEKPYTGLTANGYESSAAAGLYTCAIDGLPLFDSSAKLPKAGDTSAWPSFTAAVDSEHLIERREYSAGMLRTEVVCGRCGCHIGHVFAEPRRRRYCTNAAAMKFVPVEQLLPAESRPAHTATAELAADSHSEGASPVRERKVLYNRVYDYDSMIVLTLMLAAQLPAITQANSGSAMLCKAASAGCSLTTLTLTHITTSLLPKGLCNALAIQLLHAI